MAGPPPKDPAARRRRNATGAQKTLLPAGGRAGRAPVWPLKVAPKPAALWTSLWKMPQAVAWEQHGIVRVVARYAMLLEQAELPVVQVGILNEVRQLEDRLGLNPKAMRSLLWEITTDEVAEKRAETVAVTPAESARARLKVV